MPMPVLFAVVCGAACQETVSPTLPVAPSAQTAVSGDSIRLTYICGNTFRIRNSNDQYVEVKWDIFNTSDSGRLVLPRRPLGQPFSQVFVTANRLGTMRLFYAGRLEETKANGNRPACVTDGQETPWPTAAQRDSGRRSGALIRVDGDSASESVAVDQVAIAFDDSLTARDRAAIVRQIGGAVLTVVGERSGVIVAVPRMGSTMAEVRAALTRFRAIPGVRRATVVLFPSGAVNDARYPHD